jgi:hypothetical protein
MQTWSCKCGHKRWYGSDLPAVCDVCPDCGTNGLYRSGDYEPSLPHQYELQYDEHTGKPYLRCKICHKREPVTTSK